MLVPYSLSVCHRTDGLEVNQYRPCLYHHVCHRTDGLEVSICFTWNCYSVCHRTDGLEDHTKKVRRS